MKKGGCGCLDCEGKIACTENSVKCSCGPSGTPSSRSKKLDPSGTSRQETLPVNGLLHSTRTLPHSFPQTPKPSPPRINSASGLAAAPNHGRRSRDGCVLVFGPNFAMMDENMRSMSQCFTAFPKPTAPDSPSPRLSAVPSLCVTPRTASTASPWISSAVRNIVSRLLVQDGRALAKRWRHVCSSALNAARPHRRAPDTSSPPAPS